MTETDNLTAKGRMTRGRIVQAAAELMHRSGVAAVSLHDVRDTAGVSSSQLYHYFADRRALVEAVIEHQTAQVLGYQDTLLGELDSLDGLRAWRDAVVAAQRSRITGGCPLGSLAAELAGADGPERDALAIAFGRWEDAIRAGLTAMARRGELAADAPVDALAVALLGALEGGLLLAKLARDTAPLETTLDAMLAHVAGFAA